jgi:ketosteroid isomerase-like protein
MSELRNLQIAREMFDAWNTQDLARYVKVLHADCTVVTHHLSGRVRGFEPACDAMRQWFDVLPDLHFHVEAMVPIGEHVMTRWLATATLEGQAMRRRQTERQLQVHGCTVIELRDGKVLDVWSYWDSDPVGADGDQSRTRKG